MQFGRAISILATFLFSAFLHGLNFDITLVLLSLGAFSYMQIVFQKILSEYFDACIKILPCKSCSHKYKAKHVVSLFFNTNFLLLNILHLAYLGSVMDVISIKKTLYDTFLEWDVLHFISHHIFLVLFIFGYFVGY